MDLEILVVNTLIRFQQYTEQFICTGSLARADDLLNKCIFLRCMINSRFIWFISAYIFVKTIVLETSYLDKFRL